MEQESITASGVVDTFLVLLIGIGPKLALVPFLNITAALDPTMRRRVLRKMLVTAATVAVVVFRWANQVSAKLDENRMLVTEKVFGFLIAAIAVQLVLDGLASAGVIAPVPH